MTREQQREEACLALGSYIDITVYVVSITHRHGTDLWTFINEDTAYDKVIAYVDEWWDKEIPDEIEKPEDEVERVDRYFEDSTESWELQPCTLRVPLSLLHKEGE